MLPRYGCQGRDSAGRDVQRPAVLPTDLFPQPDFTAPKTTVWHCHSEPATPVPSMKVQYSLTDTLLWVGGPLSQRTLTHVKTSQQTPGTSKGSQESPSWLKRQEGAKERSVSWGIVPEARGSLTSQSNVSFGLSSSPASPPQFCSSAFVKHVCTESFPDRGR